MSNKPILILQMQRMGDLVLSFPLMELLRKRYPGHDLKVVGERVFFEPLKHLSPPAEFISYEQTGGLRNEKFHMVINLGHRHEAAALAGAVKSDITLGQRLDAKGRLFIDGNWHLYRASLTHNNRYNLYHWSDLNTLDVAPPHFSSPASFPPPRSLAGASTLKRGRIGLFLGASEESKHPPVTFWTDLANRLLHAGYKPVLLGGSAEKGLGSAVALKLNAPALNLCSHFSLQELTHFLKELALLVVPDTGPMHVATRTGTPVLNLSMGSVNAWETGPATPGHYVARARLSCSGCWQCTRDRLYCHDNMRPENVAALIQHMLSGNMDKGLPPPADNNLEVFRTGRKNHGLYTLTALAPASDLEETARPDVQDVQDAQGESLEQRQALSLFWQDWFGSCFGMFPDEIRQRAWKNLEARHPSGVTKLRTSAASLAAELSRMFKTDPTMLLQANDYWRQAPPLLHPFTGYAQMYIQNALGSREAFSHTLSLAERLAEGT